MLLLLACVEAEVADTGHPRKPRLGETAADTDSPPDTESPPDTDTGEPTSGPDLIALPYAEVGGTAPSASTDLAGTLDGPFVLEGGVLRFTGSMKDPSINSGALHTADGDVELVAVIGAADIGAASWVEDQWGRCTTQDLPSAPFPYGGAGYSDSSVRICVPTGLSDVGDVGVITHFHGHNATIDEVDDYQHLHAQAALSGRDAIFLLPQGPVEAADGDFGRLDEPGGFADLVRDTLALLYREGELLRPFVGDVVLASHSGGYGVTANVIEGGGLPIAAVHMFDSVYADESTFAAFAEDGGVFRSNYTSGGGTDDNNAALRATLEDAGVDVGTTFTEDTLRKHDVSIGFSDAAHSDCLHTDQAYARWLAASPLPARPTAPPELLAALADGADVVVSWREGTAIVEGSADGTSWSALGSGSSPQRVAASPWLRLVAVEGGEPSKVYGATGTRWLVVEGFDRIFGGSWSAPSHDFAGRVAVLLGDASVASNEAVAEGKVALGDYDRVLWLLGDESSADRSFDEREQAAIEAFVDAGGTFVVSGSEVGYASGDWLSTTLHADYVADDAGTSGVEGWTMGVTYPEDYPDVLDGDEVLWRYDNDKVAAVTWKGRVTVIGFAIETLVDAELGAALAVLDD